MGGKLPHYNSILKGYSSPFFHISKLIPADISLDASTSDLWSAHKDDIDHFTYTAPYTTLHTTSNSSPSTSLMDLKIELGERKMAECLLCEHGCGVNRTDGEKGRCGVLDPRVSSEFIHLGEEPELVPSHTIFFSGCNLTCIFCQNWDISQDPYGGARFAVDEVTRFMERRKSLNTNWVGGDPTPNLPFILKVLGKSDVHRAQVWNSNMYLTEQGMDLLDGVIDLYLTDFKFGNNVCGKELCGVPGYFDVVTRNHLRIKGRDTIIRHLVLPGHLECCTKPILKWIAKNLPEAVVNVMAQYHPDHKTVGHPTLGRGLRREEYQEAVWVAKELGLMLTK